MSTEIRISGYSISDDTDLRTLEFSIGNKPVKTPTRALNTNTFFRETKIQANIACLNELYFTLNETSLRNINEQQAASTAKNKAAQKSITQSGNKPTMCLLQFKNDGMAPRFPTPDEIEILTNTAYAFSDITPIPSIPKVARALDSDNLDEFLAYLDACYQAIMVRNKKPILGYVPATVPLFTRKIINFYLDHGINAFYIDFDGVQISSKAMSLNALKVEIKKRGYEENNFLHFVNVSYGKSINDEEVLSARDLLGFGQGLDSLGGVHMGPKRNPGFYEWLKTQKDVKRNTNRLLNRQNYGYYRVDTLGARLAAMIPRDAPVQQSDITSSSESRQTRAVKIVNQHQQCIESNVLMTMVNETPDKTLGYFGSKSNVLPGDLKLLSKSNR
ncbi:MAG: hypothetical protein M0Q91_06525 [Methanoregula sp.]|nr:hypothetical protein [Methanoregula sp.]